MALALFRKKTKLICGFHTNGSKAPCIHSKELITRHLTIQQTHAECVECIFAEMTVYPVRIGVIRNHDMTVLCAGPLSAAIPRTISTSTSRDIRPLFSSNKPFTITPCESVHKVIHSDIVDWIGHWRKADLTKFISVKFKSCVRLLGVWKS